MCFITVYTVSHLLLSYKKNVYYYLFYFGISLYVSFFLNATLKLIQISKNVLIFSIKLRSIVQNFKYIATKTLNGLCF